MGLFDFTLIKWKFLKNLILQLVRGGLKKRKGKNSTGKVLVIFLCVSWSVLILVSDNYALGRLTHTSTNLKSFKIFPDCINFFCMFYHNLFSPDVIPMSVSVHLLFHDRTVHTSFYIVFHKWYPSHHFQTHKIVQKFTRT